MPILGQDHVWNPRGQPVDDRDHLVAARNRESPTRAEIILNIDHQQNIALAGHHAAHLVTYMHQRVIPNVHHEKIGWRSPFSTARSFLGLTAAPVPQGMRWGTGAFSRRPPREIIGGAIMKVNTLDPAQQSAAAGTGNIQLVLAGPGAGKTTTLAGRFVHLVRHGVDRRRVLALTFTKKAEDEMKSRIAAALDLPSTA